ncbi:MAG: hypothetical protein Q7T55_04155 [Solirubrobacteraceae bacterium]|nr:hypothetical protein [Solirubrobacteraceae bacterium]
MTPDIRSIAALRAALAVFPRHIAAAVLAVAGLLLIGAPAASAAAAPRAVVPSSASIQSDGRGLENAAWFNSLAPDGVEIQTAQRRTGGKWSKPVLLTRQRSVGAKPGIWGLRTDAAGTTTLFWSLATPGATADAVYLARRPAGGAWSKPEVAPLDMPAGQRIGAADTTIGVAADGTATVVWCAYVSSASSAETSGAGMLSRARNAAGTWGPVARVFASETEYCNSPRLAVSLKGDIAVTWWGASFQGFAFKPASGAWGAPVPISASGRPVFGPDGRIHVIAGSGNSPAYAAFDATGRALSSGILPEPASRETFSGRRGAGQLASMTIGFTKAKAPVLIWNRLGATASTLKQRPAAAIWTATQVGGKWAVRPVDALGTVEDQGGFDLASDPRGTLVATWYGQSIGRGCKTRTPVYRARLSAKGAWGTRYQLAYRSPVGAGDCEPPKTWTPELNAYPQLFKTAKAAVKPKIATKTKTVAAITKAKGIPVTCRMGAAGHCAVGVTGVTPNAAWSLFDSKCLTLGSGANVGKGGAKTLRLKLKPSCRAQLKSTVKASRPVVVTVTAATDVVGRKSGRASLKIRLVR